MNQTTGNHNGDDRQDEDRHGNNRQGGQKSPEQLERELDEARARLGRTASELSDKLSPGELIDQALGMAREHGGEFGRNLGSQVKNNPMPMILTSVGLSWMMLSSDHKGAGHTHGTESTQAGKRAAMGDRVEGAAVNVRESTQDARDSLVKFYRGQPALAGSLGVAIGAALGALLPPTEVEDDMLGEASDRSIDTAKSKVAEKYEEGRQSARPE